LGGLALALLPFLHSNTLPSWAALAVWITGLLALLAVATGVGLGWAPLGEPPREDANLIATRGNTPHRWIVAHLDSKAQAHSMAGRLVAVWMAVLAVVVLTGLSAVRVSGTLPVGWLIVGAGLALASGYLAGRGRLSGRSLGARDNGTGVIAALVAAETTADPQTGILITGAEEFGLIGARVFARHAFGSSDMEFVNLDTLDEEGKLYLVSHDARGERLARNLAARLMPLGLPIRSRRLPLGIFVDSAPLARAGASSITIGRLTWRTLRRIHTAADTPHDLSLATAERVGKAIVGEHPASN
jgi:Peptidase family M28